jgi:DNA-binding NarL/FixJ family response regulator
VGPAPTSAPASEDPRTGPDEGPYLTPREEEVVRLVAEGKTNKAIARELGISPRTVEGHLNHVFDRLGLQSRTELVRVAVSTGLLVRRDPDRGGDAR